MNLQIAVQLYTLREEMEKDFIGTLEKVAEVGYSGVEFAGYGGLKAAEMRKTLDRLGLEAAASHVSIENLKNDLDEVIKYNREIGNKYIVCPWNQYTSKNDYLLTADFFNEVGKKCSDEGLVFCYHNHAHEFEKYDGKYGLDIIYDNTNKNYVMAEIDVYWVKYAGIEPSEYLKKFIKRLPLIHLKDMEKEDKSFTEIGNGIIDFGEIIKIAKMNGTEWFIVEQDLCKRSPLESIKISFDNLKKIMKEEY
ncbi:MAG: sugar phosphate isomerase/epimerase family protein [Thermoanaerobacteraceae bacterium]